MKKNKENKMKRDTFLPVVACNAYLDGMSKLSFFIESLINDDNLLDCKF